MATRVWLGGGNNNAMNAADWTLGGAPAPNDTLWMGGGTMAITGNALAGNVLNVNASPTSGFTASGLPNSPAAAPVINLSKGANISIQAQVATTLTVNVAGSDTVSLYASGPRAPGSHAVTVNLAAGATLHGGFTLQGAAVTTLTINGATGAGFDNTGSDLLALGSAKINASVLGIGGFDLHFHNNLEFGGAVAGGQTVHELGGKLTIDHPSDFKGLVSWADPASTGGEIDLLGLNQASSYTLQDGTLSLFAGNTVIDTLRLQTGSSSAFQISRSAAGAVQVLGLAPGAVATASSGSVLLSYHA